MKYKHTEDTKHVLLDLINRVEQLIEISEITKKNGFEGAKYEIQAFNSCLTLLNQAKDNGHVFRGNDYFPDEIAPLVKTPSYTNPLKV